MTREEYVEQLERIAANVRAIEQRQQQRMEALLRESRSFTGDMLNMIEQLKVQAVAS